MVWMASQPRELRYHGFALGGSRYRSLGKEVVSGGVLSWLQCAITPLDAIKSFTLYL